MTRLGLKAELADYFIYLDHLRNCGMSDMLGAGPYLEDEFELDASTAGKVLAVWLQRSGDSALTRCRPTDEAQCEGIRPADRASGR